MFWIALKLSILNMVLITLLCLQVKKLNAFIEITESRNPATLVDRIIKISGFRQPETTEGVRYIAFNWD